MHQKVKICNKSTLHHKPWDNKTSIYSHILITFNKHCLACQSSTVGNKPSSFCSVKSWSCQMVIPPLALATVS